MNEGPIIVIEDDVDDREALREILIELDHPNKIVFFETGEEVLKYLISNDVHPFLILSDINIPRINGMELRKMICNNETLNEKCIPFVFFTTSDNKDIVKRAYTMSLQGFFKKPDTYSQLKRTIRIIVDYWKTSLSPN